MSIALWHDRGVLVRAAVTVGAYGSRQLNWSAATRTSVKPAHMEQTAAVETTANGKVYTSDWLLLLRPSVDVAAEDRWEWRNRTFEVVGEPGRPTGVLGAHHVEARLRHLAG